MSIKDFGCLENILDSTKRIELYSGHFNFADELYKDAKSFDAIPMNFLGFRNIVAHDYFGIDAEEVWQIINTKIPELRSFIKEKVQ